MRVPVHLLLLGGLAACGSSSSKSSQDSSRYVEVHTNSGSVYYALRAETEKLDSDGYFSFENQVTRRRMRLRRGDCQFRSVSSGTVRQKRLGALAYKEPSPVGK